MCIQILKLINRSQANFFEERSAVNFFRQVPKGISFGHSSDRPVGFALIVAPESEVAPQGSE
jgi:hypothetical protein